MEPCNTTDTATCQKISELLSRIGDKWTLLAVRALGKGPLRFNAIRREIAGISQKMLTLTLRNLERDGFVTRTVVPSTPPQVEYALTELGRDLERPVSAIAQWAWENAQRIESARQVYDRRLAAA
jgi:DNA-binding HxlR family transcriptional regulator